MIDRVATDWRAAGSSERNCEPSVMHILGSITGTGSTNSFTGCNS